MGLTLAVPYPPPCHRGAFLVTLEQIRADIEADGVLGNPAVATALVDRLAALETAITDYLETGDAAPLRRIVARPRAQADGHP